jgi:hypothetical protein
LVQRRRLVGRQLARSQYVHLVVRQIGGWAGKGGRYIFIWWFSVKWSTKLTGVTPVCIHNLERERAKSRSFSVFFGFAGLNAQVLLMDFNP